MLFKRCAARYKITTTSSLDNGGLISAFELIFELEKLNYDGNETFIPRLAKCMHACLSQAFQGLGLNFDSFRKKNKITNSEYEPLPHLSQ